MDQMNSDLSEENRTELKEWIMQTFKRRECIKFIRCHTYSDKCGCGRRNDEHLFGKSPSSHKKLNEKSWRILDHTELYPINAFGTLEFQGSYVHSIKAEYIRLSFDTKPQNIIKLLKSYWQLELPKLIISVHGGIANFGLQTKLKQAIERGIIKVADTSQIWIITAGTDTGVVKHIGDILEEYFPKYRNNIIAIGIAPWGVVSGRESLLGCGTEVAYYANQMNANATSVNLNSCHSYFLLVDDGTVGKYGCEISFRRRLERFISRHKSEISKPKVLDVTIEEKISLQNHHSIPLLCLIIEGGSNTIQTVLINVTDSPPVPIVVCDGSGRAADLLAFAHKYVYMSHKRQSMEPEIKEQLVNTIIKTFAYKKEQAEHLFLELMKCVENKELISIYRLGEEDLEIDVALLTASLKVVDLQLSKQLDLILSWNRPDIAKKYILLTGSPKEKAILEDKMFEALSQDKVEFVQLFLEYGVNLQKFLTFKRLQDLYNCKKGPTNTLPLIIKDVIKRLDTNYKISLTDIGLVVEKLMGGGYVSEYSKRDFKLKYIKYLEKTYNLGPADSPSTDSYVFKYPYNELLIWAVLMKRHKMAMFVCKRGEETLAKSLVAAKLNKSLAREAEMDDLDSEISDEFKKYSEEFATLAYGLLDRCYKENDDLTDQLLTYDLVNWSHWTCLTLAVSCNLKDFLAHISCQMLISDLWMGGMKIRKYSTYKVIFALIFLPAIFAIQFKSAEELQYMPQTQEEHEQDQDDTDSLSSSSESYDELNNEIVSERDDPDQSGSNGNKVAKLDRIIELYDAKTFKNNTKENNSLNQNNEDKNADFNLAKIDKNNNHKVYKQQKRTVNFAVKPRSNKLKIGKKIYEFYNAPITKFWQNTLFYIVFLICFTYIVLVKTPIKPSTWEIIVMVYIFTFGLDKIRELLQTDSPRFSGKLKVFFSKVLNVMDCTFILTFMIALCFRFSEKDNHRVIARLIYCINTIYWYIKLNEFLLINKYVGPLIIIASKMLIDLFNFVIILLIVLMSFGVSRQAIKYPNEDFDWNSVKQIFLEPYFMLYGEVYAPDIDPGCSAEEPDSPGCQPGHWITPLTMTAFMIIANLLMLSILLASFNNTYMRISRQSAQVWKSQRYHLVTSYEGKPLAAPPLIIFSHIFMIIKYILRLCQGKKIKFDRKLKSFLSDDMLQRLHDFEERCFHEYDHELKLHEKEKTEEKINFTRNKVENISARIDDIFFKENMTKLSIYNTELRLQKLEETACDLVDHVNNLTNIIKQFVMKSQEVEERKKIEKDKLILDGEDSNAQCSLKAVQRMSSSGGRVRRSTVSEIDETKVNEMFFLPDSKEAIESDNLKHDSNSSFKHSSQKFYSQLSTGLDHSIHPMVYLHQYAIKPPASEYTSITDCIDTSAIDRPPSPPGNQNLNSSTHTCANLNNQNTLTKRNMSDYCSTETPRRAIAKQESEMLKLAEESQHVIIHQMFNKMQKATSASFKKSDNKPSTVKIVNEVKEEENGDEINTLSEETEISYDVSASDTLQPLREPEPMSLIHRNRNSSQIWFAQSAADTLCLDLNEDENIII